MKQWKVRAIEETDLKKFASRVQSALNAMERAGFEISIDQRAVSEGANLGRFVAVVTGHGEAPEKKVAADKVASASTVS